MASLLKEFEDRISAITLIPSDGGAFEVAVDEVTVYSKLETGRHAEEGEIAGLVRDHL